MPGTNDLGPFGAGVNETYDEPGDFGDSAGASYSWFVDCSSETSNDGTVFTAQWANRILKYLRVACDGMGIARNEANSNRLLQAIQKAIRNLVNNGGGVGIYDGTYDAGTQAHGLRSLRGVGSVTVSLNEAEDEILIDADGVPYAIAGGTANDITATFDPAIESLIDGKTVVRVKLTATNAGDATFNPNGLGGLPLLYGDGSEIAAGGLPSGMIALLVYSSSGGGHWQLQNITPGGGGGTVEGLVLVKRERFRTASDYGAPSGTILPDSTYAVWSPTYTPHGAGNLLVIRSELRVTVSAGAADSISGILLGIDQNASGSYVDIAPLHEHLGLNSYVSSVDHGITMYGITVPMEGDIASSPAGVLTIRVKLNSTEGYVAVPTVLLAGSTLVVEEYAAHTLSVTA